MGQEELEKENEGKVVNGGGGEEIRKVVEKKECLLVWKRRGIERDQKGCRRMEGVLKGWLKVWQRKLERERFRRGGGVDSER